MKTIVTMLVLSLAVAIPAISSAQTSNVPLTRAQVRAELVQLEHAGYKPSKTKYPADIQAAEARIAAGAPMAGSTNPDYGGAADSGSQSGRRVSNATGNPLYNHH